MITRNALWNPAVTSASRLGATVGRPSGEAFGFHRRLPGYRTTPLRPLAVVARWLGATCRIYVPRGAGTARIAAVEGEGAGCAVLQGGDGTTVGRAAQDAEADTSGRPLVVVDTSWPGYDAGPSWVSEGYDSLFAEIDEQLKAVGSAPGLVAVPIGAGALAPAAVRRYRSLDARAQPILLGAEPVGAGVVAGETGAAALGGLLELLESSETEPGCQFLGLRDHAAGVVLSTEGATDPPAYPEIVGRDPERVLRSASERHPGLGDARRPARGRREDSGR